MQERAPLPEPRPTPLPAAPLPSAGAVRGRHLLLVEAQPIDELVATELLQGEGGAQVSVVASLAQALVRLEGGGHPGRAGERVQLVLLALDVPDAGNAALRARLQAFAGRAGCALVALGDEPAGEAGAAHPFDAHLAKPLQPQTLFDTLARALAARGAGVAAAAAAAVSFDLGLARCLGRRELYERVARRYLEQGAAALHELEDAWRQGERAGAARVAHSLISTAGTLGATALSDAARVLYTALAASDSSPSPPRPPLQPPSPQPPAARAGDAALPPAAAAALAVVAAESARVREALQRHLAAAGDSVAPAPE